MAEATINNPQPTMKPLVVLKTGTVSKIDIKRLRENGLCVIECADPDLVRFKEPPLFNYTSEAAAAISLFRYVMARPPDATWNRAGLAKKYVDILLHGSPLEPCDNIAQLRG